jgi:hypothetical protein
LIVHLEFLKLDEFREQGVCAVGHGRYLGWRAPTIRCY